MVRASAAAAVAALLFARASWTSTPASAPAVPAVSASGQLAAQGSFVIPQPVAVSGQLSAQGSYVTPQPVVLQGALAAEGDFIPALPRPNQAPVSTSPK